jgi:hypothetical protein
LRPAVLLALLAVACHRKAPPGTSAPTEAQTISIPVAAPQAAGAPVAGASKVIDASAPIVRATVSVTIDGVAETWSLRWRGAPDSLCMNPVTAACQGFSFGEQGSLELVREKGGSVAETMLLDPLFEDGVARLQKYVPRPGDGALTVDSALLAGRPVVDVMKLADYDHDGRATEFVLQIAATTFGHQPAIVVGISTAEPRLHAFASASDPKAPIALETPGAWDRVRKATKAVTIVEWSCGERAAWTEDIARVTFAKGVLDVTRKKRACDPGY